MTTAKRNLLITLAISALSLGAVGALHAHGGSGNADGGMMGGGMMGGGMMGGGMMGGGMMGGGMMADSIRMQNSMREVMTSEQRGHMREMMRGTGQGSSPRSGQHGHGN